jgi:ATP-dependent Clp protease, protease subunit
MLNRSPFKNKVRANYRIEDKADEATVYLYDEIGMWGIAADKFVKDLDGIKAKTINLRVNSPGGSVFDGTTIYNALKQHPAKVIAHIDGLAASIASVIVMGADEVRAADNAYLMIHDPWSIVMGGAADMRKEADLLEKVGGTIAKTYSKKSGADEDEILAMMAEETWLTAEEAMELGLVDSIYEEKSGKAQAVMFDLSVFAKVPDALLERKAMPTARDLEKIMRDAGLSTKQAKALLADGFKAVSRDEDPVPVADPVVVDAPREVEQPKPQPKNRVADLLIRAEILAPSQK